MAGAALLHQCLRPEVLPEDIVDFANTRGADKIIYAGYFPMGLSLERIMTEMRDVGFKDHVWPKFLRTNALRVPRPRRVLSTPSTTGETTVTIDFTTFDADNHYYEATDAFTRHLDPKMARRAMQWAEIDGRQRLLVAGTVNRFIPNPTFDPVARPGSLDEYFRGRNPDGKDMAALFGELEPIRPEYRDRDARLAVMDAQGIDGCFLFPTLGVGMEEALADDPEAAVAAFHAFNRWLDEDWGYDYRDRIFAAPMIPLVDVDAAVAELDEVLARGARIVCIKGGPAHTPTGLTSPATRASTRSGPGSTRPGSRSASTRATPATGATSTTGSPTAPSGPSATPRCGSC